MFYQNQIPLKFGYWRGKYYTCQHMSYIWPMLHLEKLLFYMLVDFGRTTARSINLKDVWGWDIGRGLKNGDYPSSLFVRACSSIYMGRSAGKCFTCLENTGTWTKQPVHDNLCTSGFVNWNILRCWRAHGNWKIVQKIQLKACAGCQKTDIQTCWARLDTGLHIRRDQAVQHPMMTISSVYVVPG